jgi:hypothetical protein
LSFFHKINNMGRDHLGKPSGADKNESRTGIPSQPGKGDNAMTEKYTDNDERISHNVRTNHPNRNTEKGNATNAGGYKGGTGS